MRKSYDAEQRRRALRAFLNEENLNVDQLASQAGLTEGSVRHFLSNKTQSLRESSYERLAVAASDLLRRNVTAAELRGENKAQVKVTSRVGAGEQVFPIDGDPPIGWVAPPVTDVTEAFEVDGGSMRPLYGSGDLIFPGRPVQDPVKLVGRIVVAQIKGGPRVVKHLLRGSGKGRFHLASVNPAHPMLEDQLLEWAAPIRAAVYTKP